jgi:hypothetical protein
LERGRRREEGGERRVRERRSDGRKEGMREELLWKK